MLYERFVEVQVLKSGYIPQPPRNIYGINFFFFSEMMEQYHQNWEDIVINVKFPRRLARLERVRFSKAERTRFFFLYLSKKLEKSFWRGSRKLCLKIDTICLGLWESIWRDGSRMNAERNKFMKIKLSQSSVPPSSSAYDIDSSRNMASCSL